MQRPRHVVTCWVRTCSARLGVARPPPSATGDAAGVLRTLSALTGCVGAMLLPVVKEVAKSTGSHQFKVLREAGVIRMTPQGRRMLVSLRRDDLEARFPGMLETVLQVYRQR